MVLVVGDTGGEGTVVRIVSRLLSKRRRLCPLVERSDRCALAPASWHARTPITSLPGYNALAAIHKRDVPSDEIRQLTLVLFCPTRLTLR